MRKQEVFTSENSEISQICYWRDISLIIEQKKIPRGYRNQIFEMGGSIVSNKTLEFEILLGCHNCIMFELLNNNGNS